MFVRAGNIVGKPGHQTPQSMFSQSAIGSDLAADDRHRRRNLRRAVDFQHILPRHRGRILRIVVIERPDAGESMDDIAKIAAAPAASFIMHASTAQMRRAGRQFNPRSIMDVEGDGCIGGARQSVAK
jgi:hypothetical protein